MALKRDDVEEEGKREMNVSLIETDVPFIVDVNDLNEEDDGNDYEYDDSMLLQIDDDDMYISEMQELDYRRTPFSNPLLTQGENQLVDEDLSLLKRKVVYPKAKQYLKKITSMRKTYSSTLK